MYLWVYLQFHRDMDFNNKDKVMLYRILFYDYVFIYIWVDFVQIRSS